MTHVRANKYRCSFQRLGFAAIAIAVSGCSPETSSQGGVKPSNQAGPVQSARETIDPAVYRGSAIARQICAQCHDISTGMAPTNNVGAPSFASVANRPAMTNEKLAIWLSSSHPSMPNFIFDTTSIGDLAAYVMSLADRS
jgi:mono/diheme cytochrome c family protein